MTIAAKLNVGDRVRATIEGTVHETKSVYATTRLILKMDNGRRALIPLTADGVDIERITPPEPEWWARRVPGMAVLSDGAVWLGGFLSARWIAVERSARTDEQMLKAGDLVLLYDPSDIEKLPAEPTHTYPPTEPGLWYTDEEDDLWVSIEESGVIRMLWTDPDDPAHEIIVACSDAVSDYGPMQPSNAPERVQ